jgi:hypothetical protein
MLNGSGRSVVLTEKVFGKENIHLVDQKSSLSRGLFEDPLYLLQKAVFTVFVVLHYLFYVSSEFSVLRIEELFSHFSKGSIHHVLLDLEFLEHSSEVLVVSSAE